MSERSGAGRAGAPRWCASPARRPPWPARWSEAETRGWQRPEGLPLPNGFQTDGDTYPAES